MIAMIAQILYFLTSLPAPGNLQIRRYPGLLRNMTRWLEEM